MNATAGTKTFDEVLPQLLAEYSLARESLTPAHPLADQANRLTPAFAALSENVWSALPTTDFSDARDHTELAKLVSPGAGILASKQNDVRAFAESICYEAVEVRVRGEHFPAAKIDAHRAARQPLCTAVSHVNRPLEPVLTADLMARPLNEITPVVNDWFRQSCHTIAAQLLLSMHVLVELDVVGLIEWPGETTCKLNFFRHLVTQDRLRSERTESVQRRTDSGGDLWLRFETWEKVQGRNRYSIEQHEHHVINADARRLYETQYPIPSDKQAFLDEVPGWIRQHMRILEGDLILERVIERDVREEQWETEPVLRSSYELEPAILLGHYVITGWGQREIDRERFRRRRIETAAHQSQPKTQLATRTLAGRQFNAEWQWAIAVGGAAFVMMLFSRLQPSVMAPLAALLTVVAICWGGRCVANYSQWQNEEPDWILVVAVILAIGCGSLGIQTILYGILFGHWVMAGYGLGIGFLGFISGCIGGARVEAEE